MTKSSYKELFMHFDQFKLHRFTELFKKTYANLESVQLNLRSKKSYKNIIRVNYVNRHVEGLKLNATLKILNVLEWFPDNIYELSFENRTMYGHSINTSLLIFAIIERWSKTLRDWINKP